MDQRESVWGRDAKLTRRIASGSSMMGSRPPVPPLIFCEMAMVVHHWSIEKRRGTGDRTCHEKVLTARMTSSHCVRVIAVGVRAIEREAGRVTSEEPRLGHDEGEGRISNTSHSAFDGV